MAEENFLKFVKKLAIDKNGSAKGITPFIKKYVKDKKIEFNPDKLKEMMDKPSKTKGLITYRNAINNFLGIEVFARFENQPEEKVEIKKVVEKIEVEKPKEKEETTTSKSALNLEVLLRKSAISFENNFREVKNQSGTKLPWLIRMENEEEGLVMEFSVTEAQKEKIRKGRKIKLIVEVD